MADAMSSPRRGHHGRRSSVLRHGARARSAAPRLLRPPAPGREEPHRPVHVHLPRHPARPPEGRDPPGPQTGQHPRPRAGRQTRAEGHRLRRREGDRPPPDGAHAVHRAGPDRRHAGVHEPRAGGVDRPGHRHADRRVRARRDPVRALHRRPAVRPREPAQGGVPRDPAPHPRGRTAEAEHASQHAGRRGRHRGAAAPDRPGVAAAPAAWRSRLDRDEGDGEGPGAALPDRGGHRGGPVALPERRTGGRTTAEPRLPAEQDDPPAPRCGRRCGRRVPRAGGRAGRRVGVLPRRRQGVEGGPRRARREDGDPRENQGAPARPAGDRRRRQRSVPRAAARDRERAAQPRTPQQPRTARGVASAAPVPRAHRSHRKGRNRGLQPRQSEGAQPRRGPYGAGVERHHGRGGARSRRRLRRGDSRRERRPDPDRGPRRDRRVEREDRRTPFPAGDRRSCPRPEDRSGRFPDPRVVPKQGPHLGLGLR